MEKNTALSQREKYAPSKMSEFLWWLATAEKELLVDSVVDRNRYRIVGMSVLTTWIFAMLAWTYFFSTIIDSMGIAVLLGLFMGFIILTIDRALIKGITRQNKRKITPLLFRAVLALTIGTFMAQSAILYMFDKEIRLQTSLDDEQKKSTKKQLIENLYASSRKDLISRQNEITSNENLKYAEVNKARENFLSETDGSGGTGKVGIKDIAIAKRNEYLKLEEDYKAILVADAPKLSALNSSLNEIDAKIKKEENDFSKYMNNGFLTRIAALNNLLRDYPALQFRYYLIVFILMLIELMPVIAKSMLPSGSYDEKVRLREELEITVVRSNVLKEQELKELYNRAAFENDQETIVRFFALTKEQRENKIRSFSEKWKEDPTQTFDGLWEKMKKEILSKQEN